MRLHLRFALAVRLLVVALAILAGASAGAAPAAAQDACDGVWVVIDARELGGDQRTLCAPGAPANGLEALRAVGVSYTFVERVPGLVCTLDGLPDPCNGAPDDAYWAYWHAEAGGEWVYSNRGAGNRTPPPGSVEGWAFGAGEPPGRPPPAPSAAEPDPTPTSDPSPTPTTEPTASPTRDAEPSASSDPEDADAGGGAAASDDAGKAGGGGNDAADTDAADDAATSDAEDAGPDDTRTPQSDADVEADAGVDADAQVTADADVTPDVAATAEPDRERSADDEVAIDVAADGGGGGLPLGAIAGTAAVAGLAGAGVLRARRRDDLAD